MNILITGASSGLGLAAAKMLSKDNRLILVARRKDRLDELKRTLGDNVYVASVDVTDKKQVITFFDSLPKPFRAIDVLINSAGLAAGLDLAQDANPEDWETMVDTNIKGLLNMTHATLATMKQQGSGHIINIGSVSAFIPYKGSNVYGASKAFVRQFSRNLRTDLFGTGIRVCNIEPGAARTEFATVRFKDKQKADDYYKGWKPLTSEDVAKAIVWVIGQPPHVNIDNLEIMPLDVTYGGLIMNKED